MATWEPKELRLRHHDIIRLAFVGLNNKEIGAIIGISPLTAKNILDSELAQAELARLKDQAEASLTDVVGRAQALMELHEAANEAIKSNRTLMNEDGRDAFGRPLVPPSVRARIGQHFMDRVIFGEVDDEGKEQAYRKILRSLSEIERKLGRDVLLLPPVNGDSGEESPLDQAPIPEAEIAEVRSAPARNA